MIVDAAPENEWALGRIVSVLHLYALDPVPSWVLETPFWHPNGRYCYTQIADRTLRPIRNHGDDAVDESTAWLPPVPLPAVERAKETA